MKLWPRPLAVRLRTALQVVLEGRRQLPTPFDADMSGLGLRSGPKESPAFLVEWIQPSSREMCRRPGETRRPRIRPGEAQLEIAFTTHRKL